ncbi:restriction endonuclease [Salinibacter altiplanensis]|uniref:restriction endonuclease n=1 Tax=Salinibacter altiplanensis TaxID=1803181 RepID=UPI000C9F9BC1|nr:restriction endonuclease [Salinibacter altiplanensis]
MSSTKQGSSAKQDSSLQPGEKLEKDFGDWLESDQDYDSIDLNKNVSSGFDGSSYEVDVYATRKDPRSVKLAKFGGLIYAVAGAAYGLGLTELQQTLEGVVRAIAPGLAGSAFVVFLVLGGVIALYNIRKQTTHTYVECKDWKRNVGRPQVSKLAGRMKDFGDNDRRENDLEKWILVSGKGFSKPALEAAERQNISCFKRSREGFEEVSL